LANCSRMGSNLTKIAMNIVSRGEARTINEALAVIKNQLPGIQRQDIVDAINEVSAYNRRNTPKVESAMKDVQEEASLDSKLGEAINRLLKHINNGATLEKVSRKIKERSPEIEAKRKQRDDLKKQLSGSDPVKIERINKQIEKLDSEIESFDFFFRSKADIDLKMLRKALEKKIEATTDPATVVKLTDHLKGVNRAIDGGALLLKTSEPAVTESKAISDARYELAKSRTEIKSALRATEPKGRLYYPREFFRVMRSSETSGEFSGLARQGGIALVAHPLRTIARAPEMVRAAFSDREYFEIMRSIQNRENASLYWRDKLPITDIDNPLKGREEYFASDLARRIPVGGRIILGSERAYTAIINLIRVDSYDSLASSLTRTGIPTSEEGRAIAMFAAEMTGRGSLGGMENSAVALNDIFFAPRYVASRFQFMFGHSMWDAPPNARKLIAKEYARYLGGMVTIYFLAGLAGADLEDDPTSSDFGKIIIGDTRLDPTAGLSQAIVLMARGGDAFLKSMRGEELKWGDDTFRDVAYRFGGYKWAPSFQTGFDVVSGYDAIHNKVDIRSPRYWGKKFAPITWQDIYDVWDDDGLPKALAVAIPGMIGVSVQHYGDDPKRLSLSQETRLVWRGSSPEAESEFDAISDKYDKSNMTFDEMDALGEPSDYPEFKNSKKTDKQTNEDWIELSPDEKRLAVKDSEMKEWAANYPEAAAEEEKAATYSYIGSHVTKGVFEEHPEWMSGEDTDESKVDWDVVNDEIKKRAVELQEYRTVSEDVTGFYLVTEGKEGQDQFLTDNYDFAAWYHDFTGKKLPVD